MIGAVLSIVLAGFGLSAVITLSTFLITPLRRLFRALDNKPRLEHLEKINLNSEIDA